MGLKISGHQQRVRVRITPKVRITPAGVCMRQVTRRMTRADANDPRFVGVFKTCPKCKQPKPVIEDFGLRWVRGKLGPQSWCRLCRADATPRVKTR